MQIVTACPCTQAFSKYSFIQTIAEQYGINLANEILPYLNTATHVQRAWLEVEVEDSNGMIDSLVLLNAVKNTVSIPQELLKRVDEHELVRHLHNNTLFVEDIVRNVTKALAPLLETLNPDSMYNLKIDSEESIHPHNATAILNASVKDILAILKK